MVAGSMAGEADGFRNACFHTVNKDLAGSLGPTLTQSRTPGIAKHPDAAVEARGFLPPAPEQQGKPCTYVGT